MRCCSFSSLAALALGALAAEDPCASPANAVVAENCKQGVSSDIWDVNGAGSPGVRGFATQASVLQGETVEFKIKLTFGEALARVDIFRLGYYGGRGARLMGKATLDPHASSRTVTALCREGVAYSCAKWPVAASWSVDGPSGLYVARFVLADQSRGRCGNRISGAPRHRSASARWRGASTPSTRRCPRNCGSSMA